MALSLYSKDSTDTLLAAKLDLAGGTMTGGLTLSATGIIFSDATYLTTAPAGSTLAADQLTAGVVAANPTAGPTASGDVLQYDGAALVWAPGGGGGGSYLPLAGGTMTGAIVFDGTSGQYISKGNFDTSRGGNYGISLVCSIGYEFNWQAGWLITTEQSSTTPRPLYLDSAAGTTLRVWDSATSTGTEVTHTGVTFGDATTQTTAGYPASNPDGFQTSTDVSTYVTGLGYLTDAPSDGFAYNRKDGAWEIAGSGGSVAWGAISGTLTDQTDLVSYVTGQGYLTDAPVDGSAYNRKDGAWEVAGSGGSVAWGAITGTLSDQTDLNTALTTLQTNVDAKQNKSTLVTVSTSSDYYATSASENGVIYLDPSSSGITTVYIPDGYSGTEFANGCSITIVNRSGGMTPVSVQAYGGAFAHFIYGNYTIIDGHSLTLYKIDGNDWFGQA